MTDTITSSAPGTPPLHPTLVMEWKTSRKARSIVHELLDEAQPAISMAPPTTRRGVLKYFFPTEAAAAECVAMHTALAHFTLTVGISTGTDTLTYVVADGDITLTLDPDTALVTTVEVPYQEVTL